MRVVDVDVVLDGCCTEEVANAYAKSTNFMIGDSYTYVVNRYDSALNPITGQKGEMDEGYEEWLASNDPDHQRYFSASWDLCHSIVSRRNPGTLVWMWMQGHAFDDDIGLNACWNGTNPFGLWAKGPFPTMAYLRKEIVSTIAAGGTGIIFFGYMYNRPDTADKVRSLMRALSHPDVYEPALTSPKLDMGVDLTNCGEGSRAHVMVKWHERTKTAYVIAANPGALETVIHLQFPWSVAKAELLDWNIPAFIQSSQLKVHDTALDYTIPSDDGVILRITPFMQ